MFIVRSSFLGSIECKYMYRYTLLPPPPSSYVCVWGLGMDQITIKTPNPKCRVYWCLIEFIDWRYSQSCWYFWPLLWTNTPVTFSLVCLPPLPHVPVRISTGVCVYTVCNRERRGSGCVESIYRSYILYIWPDSETTKLLYHPPGPQTDKHLPPGKFLRKADI